MRPSFSVLRPAHGFTLLELLLVTTVLVLVTATAVPQALVAIDRSRTVGAVRYLSARLSQTRTLAVSRSTTVALRFVPDARGIAFAVVADGNGNGVRTREIQSGVDREIEPAVLLGDRFPGVAIAAHPALGVEPYELGGSNLLSFSSSGTSSSGSVYVRGRDGSQFVIRVLGATGRTRIQRFDPASNRWVDRL